MKRWEIISDKRPKNTGEIIKILLKNRGIITKKEKSDFLQTSLEKLNLQNTDISKTQVKKTIKRIDQAIKRGEKIVIFGDYDVDGICGTAILWETIFKIYKNVLPYIPHRTDEGYGLSKKGIDSLLSENPDVKLIITVDNGIVANDAVQYAQNLSIEVIITDHHQKSTKLPKAYSIVHTTSLCGAGVAYLLAKEIAKIHNSEYVIQNSLELAALATVADLVPLNGLNRIIVKFGIDALKKTNRIGLRAIYQEAGIAAADIDVYRISHVIAPRLNASGRIAHAMDALRLICTRDQVRADKLAKQLGSVNRERQLLTQDSTLHADSIMIEDEQKMIFVHSENYNPGIIGLVASRLVEKYYLPSIVLSVGEEFSKGSARSIKGLNIIEFIRNFEYLLVDAGGHPMAAGFTVATSKITELKSLMVEHATKMVTDEMLEKKIKIDAELNLDQIDLNLYSEMQTLSPFGMGNPEPIFVSKSVTISGLKFVGRDNMHLKMSLAQNNELIEAIMFRAENTELRIGDTLDVVYVIDKNEWKGNQKIQIKILDIN